MFTSLVALVAILPAFVNAQAAVWGQCGGIGFSKCSSGFCRRQRLSSTSSGSYDLCCRCDNLVEISSPFLNIFFSGATCAKNLVEISSSILTLLFLFQAQSTMPIIRNACERAFDFSFIYTVLNWACRPNSTGGTTTNPTTTISSTTGTGTTTVSSPTGSQTPDATNPFLGHNVRRDLLCFVLELNSTI
jgi:hypothetical protein